MNIRTTFVDDPGSEVDSNERVLLRGAVDSAGELLPAQSPLDVFIHHNTLHAFETLPFMEAVVKAGRLLGCEPFLGSDAYRQSIATGRISSPALCRVIADELGASSGDRVVGSATAMTLLDHLLRFGIPEVSGHRLTWLLSEGEATVRFRPDLPSGVREQLQVAPMVGRRASERDTALALWHTARTWMTGAAASPPDAVAPGRLRDMLLQRTHVDTDDLVHPLLIRLSAAFLDQGVSQLTIPETGVGFHAAVARLYAPGGGLAVDPWMHRFARLLNNDIEAGRDDWSSITVSLAALGVSVDDWGQFIASAALALRGWAGMFRQLELHPERAPARTCHATLSGFLAVRLLAERAASEQIALEHFDPFDSLATLRRSLSETASHPRRKSLDERAWPLFHALQLVGLGPEAAALSSIEERRQLITFVQRYDDLRLRGLLHQAYERTFYDRSLGALKVHRPALSSALPAAQVVCCLDEREESFRRYLEEADPSIETLGYAGFFGIAMVFRGYDDAHGRPLCPATITPRHEVVEVPAEPVRTHVAWRRLLHREVARRQSTLTGDGGHTLVRGTLTTAVAGTLAAIPLVARVLLPGVHARLREQARTLVRPRPRTTLALERDGSIEPRPDTLLPGFTPGEMAVTVAQVLDELGISGRLAPLVVLLGHGSTSLNNPHESAHDCGACGGGHGGANARSFAVMANHAEVRAELAESGLVIPATTWFIGGEHNTCNDAIELFDVDQAPVTSREAIEAIIPTLDLARARNAQERTRRYESASLGLSESKALAHVIARANDLAQPRPEYGHASNGLCVIGPRSSTRGLFLDRRAFLVSYDSSTDPDGSALHRVLAGALPVVAGISLEYYFSVVDPIGYGCGTKLPHNISGLLGVMDGHLSDLRTGLPWQMVEIHEPMRLLVVIEAEQQKVEDFLAASPEIALLVQNHWISLTLRDPATGAFASWESAGFVDLPVS
ncbi:MAG: DUF2309 domain-containing protein, partial [Tepidiformaceae bacterium]